MAGPPLICHPIDIGTNPSLPWQETRDWNGAHPAYDRSRLVTDTLRLLVPGASVPVRMETLRRAAIYSGGNNRLAEEISTRLMTRILDSEVSGLDKPAAWFDAGYFAEVLTQLSALEPGKAGLTKPGKPWVLHAIRLGGQGMEQALAKFGD